MTTLHPGGRIAARLSAGAAAGVIGICIAVLAGWAFSIERFMTVLPGSIRMKPNTAIALLCAGVALLVEWRQGPRWLRRLSAAVPLLFGALTLFEYVSGMAVGIDQIFFRDMVQKIYPGRMAHVTAVNLVAIALALFCTSARPRWTVTGQVLALACTLSSLFAIVGYLYGVPVLYGSINYTSMAFHTGVSFLLLSLGTFFIHPDAGLAAQFWSRSSGGEVARRLIPVAVVVPIALGAAFVQPRLNFGEMRLGLALSVMTSVMAIVALIISLARSLSSVDRHLMDAERNSTTDDLTGIHNRRYFERRLEEELTLSLRSEAPLSLILVDIDHFKSVNDRYGHQAGDAVLQWVVSIAGSTLPPSSVFCRYGGEEFAIMVPDAALSQAAAVAERMRAMVASSSWAPENLTLTVSAGVAEVSADDTPRSLVGRADQALYLAKKNGRDRVESLAYRPRDVEPVLVTAN
jgi:diguanylate cyclase (GGDEF)-like protein